ncbi:sugar ABC transporter ATP-binding protein [Fimbriimonas ginsengisoli]|uniref:ABC transporter related protein n=1 Tax=Fimbriimonas ginsengisoli Gsoil 348 TaxID=661478 RepID=A0A068NY53_FIMGI|nr:sugar ABC transporter ATP-binding protein [Fimbriimonas ginsengisoli]AIE87850.1 ABC transporter related protein [Fimbriimonas ginsengisoli Gsoil 348]
MSFLHMSGISKRFGATVALDGVELQVERGEVHALVGENGSGKSTLMRILAGAIQPDEGTMTLDGKPYHPSSPMDARKSGIAMIYQELALCPDLSVTENVLLGMEDTRLGFVRQSEQHERVRAALTQLGYPHLDLNAPVRNLPIAVRQIVEIARAVALGSSVVVLDEPTSSLTQADAQKLFEVVRTLKAEGHAIIYISHFLDEIKLLADRLTVLRDGNNVGTLPAAEVDANGIVTLMVGRTIDDVYPRSERTPGLPILEVNELMGRPKPDEATLELRRGEVLGIAGLNGSGRTELLRTIFGLEAVRSGKVKVGKFEGAAQPHQRWDQGLGMLSEDRKEEGLALTMPIADNLTLTKLPRIISSTRQAADTAIWIDKMKVRCRGPEQAIGELSGGNQQKVAIARLLYHEVDVLLLDEPTRGIDVGSKEQIYGVIDALALEGKAVLMVSSYLPELLGVCDRIAVMHKGRLGPARPVNELSQESIMQEAAGA